MSGNGGYILVLLLIAAYCITVYQLDRVGILSAGAFATNMTTFVGWLLALVTAAIHLSKTRENNRLDRKQEMKQDLEKRAFQEINAATDAFTHALTRINTPYITMRTIGVIPQPLAIKQLSEFLHIRIYSHTGELYEGVAKFVLAIEANEIAVIDFDHLRKYIQIKVDELQKLLMTFLSFASSHPLEYFFTPAGKESLIHQAEAVSQEITDIIGFLFDYRIELMNALLGPAFEVRVPRRRPVDSRYPLLTDVATKELVDRWETERVHALQHGQSDRQQEGV
jgi:hypothetical protein